MNRTIIIAVHAGILSLESNPDEVNVLVRDYDIVGADPEDLKPGEDGRICTEYAPTDPTS